MPSRRRCRAVGPIAVGRSICRGRTSLTTTIRHNAARLPYPTMSIEQLCALAGRLDHAPGRRARVLGDEFHPGARSSHPGAERLGLRAERRSSPGPRTTSAAAIGSKARPSTSSSPCAATRPSHSTNQTTLLRGPFHLVRKGAHSSKPVEAYTFCRIALPGAALLRFVLTLPAQRQVGLLTATKRRSRAPQTRRDPALPHRAP